MSAETPWAPPETSAEASGGAHDEALELPLELSSVATYPSGSPVGSTAVIFVVVFGMSLLDGYLQLELSGWWPLWIVVIVLTETLGAMALKSYRMRRIPVDQRRGSLQVDGQGVRLTLPYRAPLDYAWRRITRHKEARVAFVFKLGWGGRLVIPKVALSEADIDALRDYLAAKRPEASRVSAVLRIVLWILLVIAFWFAYAIVVNRP